MIRLHSHTLSFFVLCFNMSVKSRVQHAGRNHNINIGYNSSEKAEQFRYLGTTITNQNTIPEEINSKLRSGNACYHPVQNILSSRLLSKDIKIQRTTILPAVMYGLERGLSHWGRNVCWGCLRIGCLGGDIWACERQYNSGAEKTTL
jgi:hypothetical protein